MCTYAFLTKGNRALPPLVESLADLAPANASSIAARESPGDACEMLSPTWKSAQSNRLFCHFTAEQGALQSGPSGIVQPNRVCGLNGGKFERTMLRANGGAGGGERRGITFKLQQLHELGSGTTIGHISRFQLSGTLHLIKKMIYTVYMRAYYN